MNARQVEGADAFLAVVGPFLAAHEAEHNLALGLVGRLRVEPRLYGFDPTFVVAEDAGGVVGCLLRTPPHGAVLTRFASFEAIDAVVAAVLRIDRELPGAVGPADVVARFAHAWSEQTGAQADIAIRQRVHAASAVRKVAPVPGSMREARADDREQIIRWLEAFSDEALGTAPHTEDAEASYLRRLADPDGRWLVWDHDGPVSLAAYGSPTPSGTRIGPVYTPPELRGRGYATALVAALTEERLASGLAFCFLFTDLANPTSNAIYARIGYEPVADWDLWTFRPPGVGQD